jgi:enamine deaminase RidA (YjgF/YER057c/UK114 family)
MVTELVNWRDDNAVVWRRVRPLWSGSQYPRDVILSEAKEPERDLGSFASLRMTTEANALLAATHSRGFIVRQRLHCCFTSLFLIAIAVTVPVPAQGQGRPRFLNPSALPAPRGYSHVVEVPAGSRLLYLSGQVPLDSAGALVGGTDFRAQAHQVFKNLRAGLAAAGAGFADVVKLNFYVLDVKQLPVLREVRDAYLDTSAPPASSLVEVRRLFRDDVLLEIEAVAVVPSSH